MFQSVTDILFSLALSVQGGGQNQTSETAGDFEDLLAQTGEAPIQTDEPQIVELAEDPESDDGAEPDDSPSEEDVSDSAPILMEIVALDQFVRKISFHALDVGLLPAASAAIVPPALDQSANTADSAKPDTQLPTSPETHVPTLLTGFLEAADAAPKPEADLLAKPLPPAEPVGQPDPAMTVLRPVEHVEVAAQGAAASQSTVQIQLSNKLEEIAHDARANRSADTILPMSAQAAGKPKAQTEHITEATDTRSAVTSTTPEAVTDLIIDTRENLPVEVSLHIGREARLEAAGAQAAPVIRHGHTDPREISRNLAEKLSNSEQNRVEVTLTPEELGKVRMVITPGDTPSVAVYADNRETLDFLRRNAELLSKELRDAGFSGASLSFGEGHDGAPKSGRPDNYGSRGSAGGIADVSPTDEKTAPQPSYGRQIDMRV